MNETKISYKCNLEDSKSGSLEYAKKCGNLSKKVTLKAIFVPFVIIILGGIAYAFLDKDVAPFIIAMILALIFIPLMIALIRYSNKKVLANRCELLYRFDFNKSSPSEICLDDAFITMTSAYSQSKVPYEEVETVISNRTHFIIKFFGEEVLAVIPKRGQNVDSLFSFDNVFREKLGERFLYSM